MNTAVRAIEEDINGAGPCKVGRRRDVGQLDRPGNLAGALSDRPAMKATGTFAAMVRLDGVAVVAARA